MAAARTQSSEHRTIVRNTLYLYLRMILIMGITLYTSRIVLAVLGVDDFGIYNIVGSLVVLFSFLSGSITSATQRFLCVAIGRRNGTEIRRVFSSSLMVYLLMSAIIVLIGETVGLWFVSSELSFPSGRHGAALAVYHITIVTTLLNLMRMPYQAAIIAYERMDFFAWSSVLEVVLKLVILYPLFHISMDKLVIYAWLVCGVNLVLGLMYVWYVRRRFPECRFCRDRSMLGQIMSFTGWSSFSSFANIGSKQGLNFMFNIFYGVTVNAAVGIMNQVSNAVYGFIQNFQTAINPPIVKHYAAGEMSYVSVLLFSSSRMSYYLLLFLSMPLIFFMDAVLSMWLAIVPPSTTSLCIVCLISLYFNTFGGPIWTIMGATGHIRRYQLRISVVTLLILPASWIILEAGFAPWVGMLPVVVANIIVVFIGLFMTRGYVGFSVAEYMRRVIVPCVGTSIVLAAVMWLLIVVDPFGEFHAWAYIIPSLVLAYIIALLIVTFVGLRRDERGTVMNLLKSKIRH